MRISLTVAAFALGILAQRAAAQDTLATVARTMYGDIAVIVQVRPNQVRLAIDDGDSNLFLSFVGTDVRRWSDSTLRLLARRPRKTSPGWTSALHEPGMRQGTASLSLRPDSAGHVFSLFFADDSLITVRGQIESTDALTFARVLRDAGRMALGGASARRPPARPKD
jgi:hypothetical protein